MGPPILGRMRQLQVRDHGRDSKGTKAAHEPGSGAAGLPAQKRLRLRRPRRPVCPQACAGANVGARPRPRPAPGSWEPAGRPGLRSRGGG